MADNSKELAAKVEALGKEVVALKVVAKSVSTMPVKLEQLAGSVATLTQVVGMSRAEQKQFNDYAIKILDRLTTKVEDLEKRSAHISDIKKKNEENEKRVGLLERRQSWFGGVVAALFIVVEASKYLYHILKGN